MKITSVEPQKKNPKRFNIYLNGQFAFGADEDLVVEKRLVVGKEITPPGCDKLIFEAEVGKLMERMYGLFNIRMRSEKEVRDYLKNLSFKRKIRTRFASRYKKSISLIRGTLPFASQNVKEQEEISEIVTESLIDKLKQKGLLNDQVFAKSWVEARRASKKKGNRALLAELLQKGVDRHIIVTALEESGDGETQEKLATQALEKKMRVWRNLPPLEFKKKAVEFLLRRGFDYSVAKEVIQKILDDAQ